MSLIQAGNVRLSVVERGKGTPLVLVHGYPLDHSMWQHQINGLSDLCRVIAPDLRGFGASDVTPGTMTMEQLADDVAALLDTLKVIEPVVFCGLSMGGYAAWQFALRYRGRLARLILCDTRAVADSAEAAAGRLKTADKVLAEGSSVVADAMLPKLFAPQTAPKNPALVAATKDVMVKTSPAGIAAALRGMAERPDVSGRLHEFDIPALVLCGQHDVISQPAEMQTIAAALPKGRYVEIAAAGHMAPLEEPAAVNRAITDFLCA